MLSGPHVDFLPCDKTHSDLKYSILITMNYEKWTLVDRMKCYTRKKYSFISKLLSGIGVISALGKWTP